MGFSIIHIKQPILRRMVLLVAFIPVVITTIVWEVMKFVVKMIDQAPDVFMSAWRGY